MKVSIITIVFNNADCIVDCLKSVQSQTYPNIEHIVIDGGSTDGTQARIAPYFPKLGYYVSEPDKGLYNALNKGIRQSTGDIIGVLHSDDLFYNNQTISEIVHHFDSTKADLVYANGLYTNRQQLDRVKRVYLVKSFKPHYLYFGWIPLHTTIYVKKEVFTKYGLYSEDFRIASDYEISLRWFGQNKLIKSHLNKFVVRMRLGGKSTTLKLQKLKSSEDFSIIRQYKLFGLLTLSLKILRKIPQYLIIKFIKYY